MARKSFSLLVVGMMVRTVWCIPVIFFLCSISSADVPHIINYQGKLTTADGGCLNDTVSMTFSIYADDQGTVVDWTEDQDSVIVKEGIFNVLLGSVDTIPTSVFDGSIKYLGIQVESDPEMRPLKPMVSVAYAYRAGAVDGGPGSGWVDDGTVVRLEDSTNLVGIGATPPNDAKLYVRADSMVGTSAVYAVGGMGVKGISTAYDGTGMSGEGGHAGVAGYGGYIGVLGQGFYGGYFEGNGYFTGDVGIGTTSLDFKLDVRGTVGIDIGSNFNDIPLTIGVRSNQSASICRIAKGGSVINVIDKDGNVGIGTTEPSARLHINDTNTASGRVAKLFKAIDADGEYVDMHLGRAEASGEAGIMGYTYKTATSNSYMFLGNYGDGVATGAGLIIKKGGNIGIGTTSPQGALDVSSTAGAFIVPRMTTAQRDALTAVNGMIIYNTTTNQFNFYENGAWVTK